MEKKLIDYIRDFDQCNYADIVDYLTEVNQCGTELKAKYLQDLIWYIANEEVKCILNIWRTNDDEMV